MHTARWVFFLLLLALPWGCEHYTPTNPLFTTEIKYGMEGFGEWEDDHWRVRFILFDSIPSIQLTSVQRGEMKVDQFTYDLSVYVPFPYPYGSYAMQPGAEALTVAMNDASGIVYTGVSVPPDTLPDPEHGDASRSKGLTFFFDVPTSSSSPVEVIIWWVQNGYWVPQYRKVYDEAGLTAIPIPASVVRQYEINNGLRVSFNRTQIIKDDSSFPAGFKMNWQRTAYSTTVKVVP